MPKSKSSSPQGPTSCNCAKQESAFHLICTQLFFKRGETPERYQGIRRAEVFRRTYDMEFALNVGVQFGLTDATSDTALKFQGSLAF